MQQLFIDFNSLNDVRHQLRIIQRMYEFMINQWAFITIRSDFQPLIHVAKQKLFEFMMVSRKLNWDLPFEWYNIMFSSERDQDDLNLFLESRRTPFE